MALSDFPYSFGPQPILDPTTNTLVQDALGGKAVDPATGAVLSISDLNGNPVDQIKGSPFGTSQWFRSTQLAVLVKFGDVTVQCVATELFALAQNMNSLSASAAAASSAAQASASSASSAAAAAQQAAASAAAGGGSGTGAGLSTTALDGYLNGTSTASAAGLIQRVIGFRLRATPTDASTAWAARPAGFLVVAAVGPGPGPTDSPPAGCIDVDWTYTS